MDSTEYESALAPWSTDLASPFLFYDGKDVCRYDNRSRPNTVNFSSAYGTTMSPGSFQPLVSTVQDKRLKGTESNFLASNKLMQVYSVPPPPLSSSEYDRLTPNELHWLGSLSDYSCPQVFIVVEFIFTQVYV